MYFGLASHSDVVATGAGWLLMGNQHFVQDQLGNSFSVNAESKAKELDGLKFTAGDCGQCGGEAVAVADTEVAEAGDGRRIDTEHRGLIDDVVRGREESAIAA